MKGPKTTSIAHKKLDTETMKKRKGNDNVQKEEKTASKKNSGAPKRPASAFFAFIFLNDRQDFRKTYKENFPDNKSVGVVGKTGGEKWKSMSDSEKAPYVAKANNKKAEYELAMKEFKNLNGNGQKPEGSEKSSSEIHDDAEQEASS